MTRSSAIWDDGSVLLAIRTKLWVLLVLGLWILPAGNAMALSLHVAVDHDAPGSERHQHLGDVESRDSHDHGGDTHDSGSHPEGDLVPTTIDLRAIFHGHEHPEVVPDHQHSATSSEVPGCTPLTSASWTVTTQPTGALLEPALGSLRRGQSRAGPPDGLFTIYCSLRL